MVRIGNFFFHYRNGLFPLVYALLFVPSRPIFPDYRMAALAGLLVALSGQSLRAITVGLDYIIRGGRNRQVYAERLVIGGLFSHCRNPLYVGNLAIILGLGLASNSLLYLCAAVPFFLFAYRAIVAAEENFLRNKFGGEFDDYCARVNRFLPNISEMSNTLSGMYFNWRRVITAEYGSAFYWIVAMILVTLKNIWHRGEYQTARGFVIALWVLFGVVVLAYAVARFLKKTGRLSDEPRIAPEQNHQSA